jgi:hypothetical protein
MRLSIRRKSSKRQWKWSLGPGQFDVVELPSGPSLESGPTEPDAVGETVTEEPAIITQMAPESDPADPTTEPGDRQVTTPMLVMASSKPTVLPVKPDLELWVQEDYDPDDSITSGFAAIKLVVVDKPPD